LKHFDISEDLIPRIVPTFGEQGRLLRTAARELGLKEGIPLTYRAGDQPNNALSLNVMEPGEIAATAGTSGVVYGVCDTLKHDPASRVNSFAHVNYTLDSRRIGVLLCINGTGIANSWIRRVLGLHAADYARMNELAASAPVGSDGILCLPFGNGAERMLENKEIGAHLLNLQFNVHGQPHLLRSVQEGLACSFKYGIDIMKSMGIKPHLLRAGMANMFLSPVFCITLAQIADVTIELYNTDGAQGAARGAAYGGKYFTSRQEMFKGLEKVRVIEPGSPKSDEYKTLYRRWSSALERFLA
jgi:xylulokinase